MSKDVRSTAIDELEVSVKTAAFLEGLGVATLGELLALPRIEAPKVVAGEIEALFEELEVAYDGEVVAKAGAAPKKVSGGIGARLASIEAWLDENKPHLVDGFRPPADGAAIERAERALAVKLPADYVELLRMHDGQEPGEPMVATCTLLPIEDVVEQHARLLRLFAAAEPVEASAVDAGIKKVAFSPSWIPIGRSARGRDVLCLDLDPDRGGRSGQVILLAVDDDARNLVASSVSDLLTQYFDALQSGELDEEEEEDDFPSAFDGEEEEEGDEDD